MKTDGRCHCGQITFEAEVNPDDVTICHCTDCQRFSGSAFRTSVPVPVELFVLLSGTPNSYVKTAESGNQRRQAFCGNCGTAIYACAADSPQSYSLRVGTLRQRAALIPRRQIWRRSALPWVNEVSVMPASEKQ
ncbi:MAG: GFA family protein [Methylobacteriaceae bacterium]|nr:GFA family protein [Methylobacteriaceae bacterium]